MFQSNAAKEVLYIFLWLIGIIFVYGLVHTFFLEPSNTTASINHAKHAVIATPDAHKEITKDTSKHSKLDVIKAITTPSISSPIAVSKVPDVPKVMPMALKTKVAEHVEVTVKKIPTKEKITTQEVAVSVDAGRVPALRTPAQDIENTKLQTAELTHTTKETLVDNKVTLKSTKTTEKAITVMSTPTAVSVPSIPTVPTVPSVPNVKKVEDMKLLDTAKQHVKAASTEIVNVLNK